MTNPTTPFTTTTTTLLTAFETRRSLYSLAPTSPISDSQIHSLVTQTVKDAPSAFNMQSARCIVLLKDQHQRLWDICREVVEATFPAAMHGFLFGRIAGFREGYGTVLFYEDPVTMREVVESRPSMKGVAHLFPQWSEHSSGMHQYALWTLFSSSGLGCNLQHYEGLEPRIAAEWNVPSEWQCKAQLVFGQPTAGPRNKEADMKPLAERVFLYGGDV